MKKPCHQNTQNIDEILDNLNAIKSYSLSKKKPDLQPLSPTEGIKNYDELSLVKKDGQLQNIDELKEINNWNNISIDLDSNAFKIKKKYVLSSLSKLDNSYHLQAFFKGNKVKIFCNNSVNSFLIQNIFGIPTKEELSVFGKADYTIFIADIPKNNSNSIESNQGSIDIDIHAKEIIILGDQFLWGIELGLFLVLNEILIEK